MMCRQERQKAERITVLRYTRHRPQVCILMKHQMAGRLSLIKGLPGQKGIILPHRGRILFIVDPGHGFTDEGCSSEFIGELTEKELTLAMAEELRTILEGYGVNVIMLHDGKSFPSLPKLTALADSYSIEYDIAKCVDNNIFSAYERTVYANYLSKVNDVDLYISIHVNAMENNPDYSGFEIDYCAENEAPPYPKFSLTV